MLTTTLLSCADDNLRQPPTADAAHAPPDVDARPGVMLMSLLSVQTDGYIAVTVTAWSDCSGPAVLFDGTIKNEALTLTSPTRVEVCQTAFYHVIGGGIDKLISWDVAHEDRTHRLLFRGDEANLTTTIRITA
jgi:hypothetical protein